MGARDLLNVLSDAGFEVRAEHGALLVRPMASLPPDLRQQVVEHKLELLSIAPRRLWRVLLSGRPSFVVCCPQGATADEIRSQWVGAQVEAQG